MTDTSISQYLSNIDYSRKKAKLAIIEILKKFKIWPKHFCLISGAPRSATSAMSIWLSHHPDVAGFSEERLLIAIHKFMEEIYRFDVLHKKKENLISMSRRLIYEYFYDQSDILGKSLILNKEPLEPIAFPDKRYKKFLENVRILFPEAKFLFMIRDQIATVFSMSQKKWGFTIRNFEPRKFSIEEHIENWCSCVDCILQYADDPNTYICQFGRLLRDSENESKQILDFLNIRKWKPFQPRQPKAIGFNMEECEFILKQSRPQLEALYMHCISDLT